MIDFERIVIIAKSRGIREEALARELGINSGHLWRLKTGRNQPSAALVARAIALLDIDLSDITVGAAPHWTMFPTERLDLLSTFHEQFRSAESILTVTNCMDSYIQEEWMLEWSNRSLLEISDWEDYSRTFYPYAREQTTAREHSNFLHRLVCPWTMFGKARLQQVEWLACLRDGIGDYEDATVVTPVWEWASAYDLISRLLPRESGGWTKICIVDSVRVLVHVRQKVYLSCANEEEIRRIRQNVERIIRGFEPLFPKESELIPSKMRDTNYYTLAKMEKLLMAGRDVGRLVEHWEAFLQAIELRKLVELQKLCDRARGQSPTRSRLVSDGP